MSKPVKTPQLREKLRPYGLDRPSTLAKAMGLSIQRAHQLLRGDRFGLIPARKIAALINISWQEVHSWQEDGR